jgi:hypothetical protein
MSTKTTSEKDKEEARAEGPRGFPEACRSIMEDKLPDCCGTGSQETEPVETADCCGQGMQGMMARMKGAFQTKPEK